MTPAVLISRRCRDCGTPIQAPRLRRCAECVSRRIEQIRKGQK